MLKCNACGGTFAATLPDGAQYFHVCPPLSAVELGAAVAAGKVVLPFDVVNPLVRETPDQAVLRRVYQRANFRDENLVSTAAKDVGSRKSDGAGVTVVAAPAPPVVVV